MKKRSVSRAPLAPEISRADSAAAVFPHQDAQDGVRSDVLGSYTGHSLDGTRPVQDADDL